LMIAFYPTISRRVVKAERVEIRAFWLEEEHVYDRIA
jgi:hypothetical protein